MTPFAIFFLRQFFLGITREVEEAAKLDGAGHWRVFFRIILPMSCGADHHAVHPDLINTWNEYFWPLLVGNNDDTRVLTVALGVFKSQTPQTGAGLGRADGRHPGGRAADADRLHALRQADRQLDRLLGVK